VGQNNKKKRGDVTQTKDIFYGLLGIPNFSKNKNSSSIPRFLNGIVLSLKIGNKFIIGSNLFRKGNSFLNQKLLYK